MYRNELSEELKRNVGYLNTLLYEVRNDFDAEGGTEHIQKAIIATENPLKCHLISPDGTIIRSLGLEALSKKIRALESKNRLKKFQNQRGLATMKKQPADVGSPRESRLIDSIRILNMETMKLMNKLKYQTELI